MGLHLLFLSSVCLVLFFTSTIATSSLDLIARFSSRGVKATVKFSRDGHENVSVIKDGARFDGDTSVKWQVKYFPVQYDMADPCNSDILGRTLHEEGNPADNLELSGMFSIEGRSLVLLNADDEILSCATIERTEPNEYVTARAIFSKDILGTVVLRQHSVSATALTRVSADLVFNDKNASSNQFGWQIVSDDDCSSLSPLYTQTSEGSCSTQLHTSCAVGNLEGKLGKVTVGSKGSTEHKTCVTDLNLPLSGDNSVIGKTIQIFAVGDTKPRACATISAYVQRTGVATFDQSGVTGTITMTQSSPFDSTTTHVALKNLRSLAGGYHVHKWPVPQRLQADQSLCSGTSVSGHFNPFGIVYDDNTPAPAEGTEDQYEVGDLARKYGTLAFLKRISKTFTDYSLPLFGVNSVLGRSIVIHKANGARWVCSTIRDTSTLTYALATFNFPVIGYVLFQQRKVDGQDMSVYVQLDYADGSTDITQGHSLVVNDEPTSSDWLSTNSSTRCLSTGDIFDPFSEGSKTCSSYLQCNLGDLSRRHGLLSVRAEGAPSRAYFTDVGLSLTGTDSVIGKSVVLTGADGSDTRLACGNVKKLRSRQAEVTWSGKKEPGSVTFTQNAWIIQEPTSVQIDLTSYPDRKFYFDITTLPVPTGKKYPCRSVRGVYNPFNINNRARGTKDELAVGDLSRKFGRLSGLPTSRNDPTLDLMGPLSVVGRTLLIRTMSRWKFACGSIEDKMVNGGMEIFAVATFTGDVQGHITLRQYIYPDGTTTHTTATVDVKKSDGEQTKRHKWHVHQNTVGDDGMASSGRCASTGSHYNPFMVNVKEHYDECQPSNPLRCELGDQASKLGLIDMNNPMLGTDVNLPLIGPFTVLGRSIVIHAENAGAPRIACADLLPHPDTARFYDIYVNSSQTVDKSAMVEAFSSAVKTPRYNVIVVLLNAPQKNGCSGIRVYFLGRAGPNLKQKFSELVDENSDVFDDFNLCKRECSG